MIENIRKYKGLIIVGIALVVFALVIGIKDDLFRGNATGRAILKIAGRNYTDKEFHKLGSGSFELATSLAQAGDFGLYQFVMGLSTGAASQDEAKEKFFIGRMIIRQAKEEFGVFPDDAEIAAYLRGLRAFSNPEGEFDEANYRRFIEKGIGRLGMTETDLQELASDVLSAKKINEIVGSGLAVNREVVAADLALQNQQIALDIARLDIAPFEAEIKPTDEQIKEYWELIQDSFTTEPRRKFSYIIASPDMPEESADETEEPESIADAALSDEDKKKKADEKAAEKAKKAAELAETRRKKQLEVDGLVDNFTYELEQKKGVGFKELAEQNGWTVVTTELFPQSTPPEALDINLRSSSRGGKAVDELFKIKITSDPISKISQPIAIGENQWLVAVLEEQEESEPKTFEQAKAEAKLQYIREKAAEAMKTAAEEAATRMKEALAGGKSFTDAAKEAGIEHTKELPKVTSTYRPDPSDEPRTLFEAARHTDAGSFADIVTEDDRTFIVHVVSREVVKEENAETRLDSEVASRATRNGTLAFNGWITARTEAAKVEQLYKN